MTEEQQPTESTADAREVPEEVEQLLRRVEGDRALPVGIVHRDVLDREIRFIKDAILRMGSLCEDAIRGAAEALVRHDADKALEVIRGDALINEVQVSITRLVSVTIATQQPVARDLRLLLTLDHVSYELERVGDHAASVAKAVIKLSPEPPLEGYVHMPEMADLAARVIHGVLRALVAVDPEAAREAAGLDDEIDTLYHATFDETVELMRQDPANVERGARIILASHYLERIGDRATNVAEDVVFLATGEVEDLNP
jgi:phosphate transport system protein